MSCQAAEAQNRCRVTLRLRATFFEIVDFDVVNATILIVLFSLIYILDSKKFTYILFKKVVLFHMSLYHLDRENLRNGNKNDINVCTL